MKAPPIRPLRAAASAMALLVAVSTPRDIMAQDEAAAEAADAEPADGRDAQGAADDAEAADQGVAAESDAEGETTLGSSTAAGAQADAEAEADARTEAADAKAEAADEGADAIPAEPTPATPSAGNDTAYGIGVMRLPASAYPELRVRGIDGGSLWFTMHGVQWPYMPMLGETPGVMVGVSGYAWVDPSYAVDKTTEGNGLEENRWRAQGRFVLRATPTYSNGDWFVQGQAELVANSDQISTRSEDPDTDDLWVRAGQWNSWDVQIGRYEAWEIYHFGMGLDLNTFERAGATAGSLPAPEIYGVTYGYYRSTIGNVAGHIYPTDFLRFELLGKFGNETLNTYGGRPAAVLDLGMIKFKVAGEYIKEQSFQTDVPTERVLRGAGAALQFVLDPYVEAGVNGAYGLVDSVNNQGLTIDNATFTTYSYGGFANARVIEHLIVGAGANYTWKEDVQEEPTGPNAGQVGEFDHVQAFAAVQYALFGQLYLKLVGAYAKARMAPTLSDAPPYEDTSYSARFRVSFYF